MSIKREKRKPSIHLPAIVNVLDVKEVVKTKPVYNEFSYEQHKGFKNYLPYPVTLIDRNNLAVRLPPQNEKRGIEKNLIVESTISYCSDVQIDVYGLLDEPDDILPPELIILKENLNKKNVHITYGRNTITFEYSIPDRLLRNNDYCIYSDQLDFVICKTGHENGVVHPHSQSGKLLAKELPTDAMTYQIFINDPDMEFGERYVNFNGVVLRVPVGNDPYQKPGVYVYINDKDKSDAKWYSFTDADERLKLYSSRKRAEDYGHTHDSAKSEYQQAVIKHKQDLLDKEKELNEIKQLSETKDSKRKEELELLKHEIMKREHDFKQTEIELKRIQSLENQKLNEYKDMMERRSADRKDSSEIVKWVPAIVGAAAALFGLFMQR